MAKTKKGKTAKQLILLIKRLINYANSKCDWLELRKQVEEAIDASA